MLVTSDMAFYVYQVSFICALMFVSEILLLKIEVQDRMTVDGSVRIKCYSGQPFYFIFTNYEKTSTEIARCIPGEMHFECNLFEETYKKYYSTDYTLESGILVILKLEQDVYGQYNCTDAFDPTQTEGVMITDRTSNGSHASNNSLMLLAVIVISMYG
ncbi:hypothetical protein DPMN_039160 [Dreissena polymorpha]|uniref:Uncharacterized protein n=1 Tax=Dreissena polymorpha TaxID=45954 RepID=A0A9D4RPB4_DREPO|nr:hypothetical protein DPMN_039160 [Dreissena polymorpha]